MSRRAVARWPARANSNGSFTRSGSLRQPEQSKWWLATLLLPL